MDPSEFEGTVAQNENTLHYELDDIIDVIVTDNNKRKKDMENSDAIIDDLLNSISISLMSSFSQPELMKHWENMVLDITEDDLSTHNNNIIDTLKAYSNKLKEYKGQYNSIINDTKADSIQYTYLSNSIGVVNEYDHVEKIFLKEYNYVSNKLRECELFLCQWYRKLDSLCDPSEIFTQIKDACKQLVCMNNQKNNKEISKNEESLPEKKENEECNVNKEMELIWKVKQDIINEYKLKEKKNILELEKEKLKIQEYYESICSQKDVELQELLDQLNINKDNLLIDNEKDRLYDIELKNHRQTKSELNQKVIENSELMRNMNEFKIEMKKLREENNYLIQTNQHIIKNKTIEYEKIEKELNIQMEKNSHLRNQLQFLPSQSDLQQLLFKILGKVPNFPVVENNNDTNNLKKDSAKNDEFPLWKQIEMDILKEFKKQENQLIKFRIEQEETQRTRQKYQEMEFEFEKKLNEKIKIIESLEMDIVVAHQTIEAGQNIIRGFAMGDKNKMVLSSMSSNPNNQISNSLKENSVEKLNDLSDILASRDASPKKDEKQERTNNSIYTGQDGASRMLHAIQSQRDRYMQLNMEKDEEIQAMKHKIDHSQQDSVMLRNENVELYKRLRHLRMQMNTKSNSKGIIGHNVIDDDVGGIEMKYSHIYEQEYLNPYQLLEIDKQLVISQMNVFEQTLSYMTKYVIQDRYSRHVFIIYMTLLHLFAFGYVFQVLNPEIIEEIDHPHHALTV